MGHFQHMTLPKATGVQLFIQAQSVKAQSEQLH